MIFSVAAGWKARHSLPFELPSKSLSSTYVSKRLLRCEADRKAKVRL